MLGDRAVSVDHPKSAQARKRHHRQRERIARLVTELLAPAPLAAALLSVVAWRSAATPQEAIAWAGITVLFASLIPIAYVIRGVRKRRLSDRHVVIREQRRAPLLIGIASVFIGLLAISAMGAPRTLVALVGSMLVGLTVSLGVTIFWKMSIHTAVVAGSVVILALTFGPILLLTAPFVALTAWSRVELGDHTTAQVVVGGVLGAAVAVTTFPLLR